MTRIVVGIDGSPGSAGALRWAAREADVRGAELTAVMAWGYLDQHHLAGEEPFDPHYTEADARAAAEDAVAEVLGTERTATVEVRAVNALANRALVEAAEGADLLVVGARGFGGFRGLLVGSVSQYCLHHAPCPVAVIRPGPRTGEPVRRIVVGVDGSEVAAAALAWALDEGRFHEAQVDVVHAWMPVFLGGAHFPVMAIDPALLEDAARSLLDDVVAAADTRGASVAVTKHLVEGGASGAILDVAESADLVVVGSRGRGAVAGMLLGSVSHQVSHHAAGPVVVVPEPS